MDNNLKKLQWVPYGTPEHTKLVHRIQMDIKSRDFILCMKGIYEKDRSPYNDHNTLAIKTQSTHRGIANAFEGDENVFTSDKYYFVRRDKAEYNLEHRQVNVGILVTDRNNNVLVLKKKNGYLSLVGGHTDFTRDAYNMTVKELCHYNITKEFSEEVKCDGKIDIPKEPFLFVTEGNEMWDYFHCWYLYHVEVDDLYAYNFKTNEKDKHETFIIPINDLIENYEAYKIKNSLRQSVNTLVKYADELRPTRVKVSIPTRRPELTPINKLSGTPLEV